MSSIDKGFMNVEALESFLNHYRNKLGMLNAIIIQLDNFDKERVEW